MNTQNTLDQLKSLKLSGMANRYEATLQLPVHELQDVHSLVGMLTQAEVEYRNHARTQSISTAVSSAIMPCPKIFSVQPSGESPGNRCSGYLMGCLLPKEKTC